LLSPHASALLPEGDVVVSFAKLEVVFLFLSESTCFGVILHSDTEEPKIDYIFRE
jgi:hypothetical protein